MSSRPKTVLILATLDTKGEEALFLKREIESKGLRTITMDVGVKGEPYFEPEIPRQEVAQAVSQTVEGLLALRDEAKAMGEMARGAERIVSGLQREGTIDGAIAVGGTIGTALALKVLRALPVGFPKAVVSTVAISPYVSPQEVGTDVVLYQAASDFWGLNRVVRRDLERAALAMASAVKAEEPKGEAPLVAITTLGGSWLTYTFRLKEVLQREGYEVVVFHSVSMQGAIMERLIREGEIKGLLDLCPIEVLAEIAGGDCCSPGRMKAAAEKGIPQIVGPGGIGVFPWRFVHALPERFKGRRVRAHSGIVFAVKATKEEMVETAQVMASRLNRSKGPVAVVVPTKGFFGPADVEGYFYDPEGRKAFIETLRAALRPNINFILLDCHINDPEYAEKVAEVALELLGKGEQ